MTASRLRAIVFVTGALMAGAIAQAQQPAPGAKSTSATTSASVPASSPAAVKAASSDKPAGGHSETPSVQKSVEPSPQLLRDARNAGFKPQTVGGNLMFCRVAVELGSNFPVRTCYDEEHLKIKIQEYQAQRQQMEQQKFLPPACHPPTC